MLSLLALALSLQDPAAADAMFAATSARAAGTLDELSTRWTADAEARPADPIPALRVAYAHLVAYDFGEAEARFGELRARLDLPGAAAGWAAHGAGLLELGRGAYAAAGERFAVGEDFAREIGDSSLVALALTGRAEVAVRIQSVPEALRLFDEALAWADETGRAYPYVLCSRSAYDLSISAGRLRAAADRADAWGDPHIAGRCYFRIALRYIQRGEADSVEFYQHASIERLEAARDLNGLSTALQWAGYYDRIIGAFARAETRLHRAIEFGRASSNESAVAWSLLNLAAIASALGDVANGIAYARDAEALLRDQGDLFGLSTVKGLEGSLWRLARDSLSARTAYSEALDAAERLGHIETILGVQQALGELALEVGNFGGAERRFGAAERLVAENGLTGWRESVALDFADLAARRGELRRADSLYHAVEVADRTPTRQAQLLTRMAGVQARLGAVDSALVLARSAADIMDLWRTQTDDQRLRLYALQREAGDRGLATTVSVAARAGHLAEAFELADRRRARELLDQMARQRAMGGRPLGERSGAAATLDQVQTSLVERLALLTYTAAEGEPTTIFLVTRDSVYAEVTVPVDSIRADAMRLRSLVESGVAPDAVAGRLGGALLPGALRALPDEIDGLAIVPEAEIHRVVFDVLPIDPGQALVDRFALSSVPSAAIASELWSRPAVRGSTMLAMGNPDPPDPSAWPAFARTGGLPPLPGAEREARSVARYARDASTRVGEGASEAHLRSADLSRISVLHLATHAVVDEQTSTRTALALAPGAGHDGYLTAAELGELALTGALVVLSACRSGGGEVVRGEGLQGLTAPLLRAGASAVVATRWRGDDALIGPFVERVYGELAAGYPVDVALRNAKQAARADGVSPAIWSAFTVVGDGSVRVPLRRPPVWAEAPGGRGAFAAGITAALLLLLVGLRGLSARGRRSGPTR